MSELLKGQESVNIILGNVRKERRRLFDELYANDENPSYNKRKTNAYLYVYTYFLLYSNNKQERDYMGRYFKTTNSYGYFELKNAIEEALYIVEYYHVAQSCNKWKEEALEELKKLIA